MTHKKHKVDVMNDPVVDGGYLATVTDPDDPEHIFALGCGATPVEAVQDAYDAYIEYVIDDFTPFFNTWQNHD